MATYIVLMLDKLCRNVISSASIIASELMLNKQIEP